MYTDCKPDARKYKSRHTWRHIRWAFDSDSAWYDLSKSANKKAAIRISQLVRQKFKLLPPNHSVIQKALYNVIQARVMSRKRHSKMSKEAEAPGKTKAINPSCGTQDRKRQITRAYQSGSNLSKIEKIKDMDKSK